MEVVKFRLTFLSGASRMSLTWLSKQSFWNWMPTLAFLFSLRQLILRTSQHFKPMPEHSKMIQLENVEK
jgi:hypothetical protein